MSPTVLLLILFMSFATIGVAASIFMGRRGHNPFAWLLLGAILSGRDPGDRCRGTRGGDAPTAGGRGRHQRWRAVDVLVGIDGSPEAEAAMRAAASLFGPLIGRLTLATVEDFDTAGSRTPLEFEHRAVGTLERVASSVAAQRTKRRHPHGSPG